MEIFPTMGTYTHPFLCFAQKQDPVSLHLTKIYTPYIRISWENGLNCAKRFYQTGVPV